MNRYVVVYMNFFDNELKSEIIEAESPKQAIAAHSCIRDYDETLEWLMEMPDDLESIKDDFFNSDQLIDVVEV